MATHINFWGLTALWGVAVGFFIFLIATLIKGPNNEQDNQIIGRYESTAVSMHNYSDTDDLDAEQEMHAWNQQSMEDAKAKARQEEDDQRRLQEEWDEEHRNDCLPQPWEDHLHSWYEGRR